MGKTALLVPNEDMLQTAHNILQEGEHHVEEIRVIQTHEAVSEARRLIAEGIQIIIARGLQASLIKRHTDIPVVEIAMTAQEMALLVMRAKQILHKEHPVIAVVGFENMYCDMSFFNELYDIDLRLYYVKQGEELAVMTRKAVEEKADLVIGGDTAVEVATENGIPSLYLSTTEDALKQAFSVAKRVEYAMEVEKKTSAQMDTLLDYSYNGVIRLDEKGNIVAVNSQMQEIMGETEKNLHGLPVTQVIAQIDKDILAQVLEEGREYNLFLDFKEKQVYALMAPVIYEEKVEGAIITCHRMNKKTSPTGSRMLKSGEGQMALAQFEDILQDSRCMKECVRRARLYAMSDQSVMIVGETGTEKRFLAECIHNNSSHSGGPFLTICCEGLSQTEQSRMIFGERGAAMQAHGGTLLLQDIQALSLSNQHRLVQLIRFQSSFDEDYGQIRRSNVRILATGAVSLKEMWNEKAVCSELYYLLAGLELEIPPLRHRQEDLQKKLEQAVRGACDKYSVYHVLTAGAKQALADYGWPGNHYQIDNFCDRLILTAGKRSIDEIAVRKLLYELYPKETEIPGNKRMQQSVGAGKHRKQQGIGTWGDESRSSRIGTETDENQSSRIGIEADENQSSGIGTETDESRLSGTGIRENDDRWNGAGKGAAAWEGRCYEEARFHEEARRIMDALWKHNGSREKTARELGISKATLWRHMKKYGIE